MTVKSGSSIPWMLAAAHLCVCAAIALQLIRSEGSWAWFLVFLIDLPASILMLLVTQFVDPLLVFGILGTAWWYLIGRVFVRLLRWVLARGEVPQP